MQFIHLTDTHLTNPGKTLFGIDPAARLRAAVADINGRFAGASFVIVTGDLAHRGDPDAYDLLRTALDDLKIPVHLGIGNHDNRANFLALFPRTPADGAGFVQYSFVAGGHTFVMLDSVDAGKSSGILDAARLNWLRTILAARKTKRVFLFLHHAPVALGIPDLDDIGLRNAAEFGDVLSEADCVRHIFFGHVHRPVSGTWRGIPFSTQRSLVNQSALNPRRDGGILDNLEPPAYSIVNVAESGDIVVHHHDFMDESPEFYISGLHALDEGQNPATVDGTFTQP